ncbi:MAG: exopolysaccharide biosynthesis polyprenyl glycosylphosphotransferase [Pseudomonadota bacterium]
MAGVFVIAISTSLSGTALPFARLIDLVPHLLLLVLALGTMKAISAWRFTASPRQLRAWLRIVNGLGLAMVLAGAAAYFIMPNNPALVTTSLGLWLAFSTQHGLYRMLLSALSRTGHLAENVIIVGATENARNLISRNSATGELNIVGVFDDRLARAPSDIAGVPVIGTLDDLLGWSELPNMDRIVVTVTSDARTRVRALIDRLRILPQRVVLLLDLDGFDPETISLSEVAHSPAAYVSGAPQDVARAATKRIADIVFASAMLVAFSPVFLATAMAIRLDDSGPIFFRQRRQGFNNQIIRVWKFRSMSPDRASEERMVKQTFAGDSRVTRVGKLIRATSIDELPQLINVLKGEMSLVGPRPHAVGMTTEQTALHNIVSDYAHRHRVKPGITGWAQVNGSRGPVHSKKEMRERVRLDLEYVNRSSFWFDFYIMAMTAPCLLGDRLVQR